METLQPLFRSIVFFATLAAVVTGFAAAPKLEGDRFAAEGGDITIHPINHATFVIGWKEQAIYVDPVGEATRFQDLPPATLVLVTDIHGDHFDKKTLGLVASGSTPIVAPQAVADQMDDALRAKSKVLKNGDSTELNGIKIEALPMYNLTPDRLKFHNNGRGNGYLLTVGGKRIYISGDTEDIPEMRALKNIEIAFVCMNLPYTMTVEQAADAVKAFKPKVVYPYHYRGSDLEKFKMLVGNDSEVRLRDWYKK